MKSLQDALYNWLSISVVSDARPDDTAARETTEMFRRLLETDYKLTSVEVASDEEMYYVKYMGNGQEGMKSFPRELIDCIINSMNEHPDRYKNYK